MDGLAFTRDYQVCSGPHEIVIIATNPTNAVQKFVKKIIEESGDRLVLAKIIVCRTEDKEWYFTTAKQLPPEFREMEEA
jgi:hypothetical protein